MRWSATLSAFAKVWPYTLAAIACIAGVVRLISSDTPTSTTHILVFVCITVGLVSVGVGISQGRREYERLTTTVLASLKGDLEHGGDIKRYRLVAQSSGEQLRDVKIWVQEPNPNWISSHFSGYGLHFPYRLWRPGIGSEPDGCSINPRATEFFDLLRWWVSGTGDLQVELNSQTLQAPLDDWVFPIKIEWSVGSSESEVLIHRVQDQLELKLKNFVSNQQKHRLMKESKWSRSEKWTAAGVMIAAIGIIIALLAPAIRRKLGLEKSRSALVSKPEEIKPAAPSPSAPSEGVPLAPTDASTKEPSPIDRLSELGWIVRPEGKNGKRFVVSSGIIPPMDQSAEYFRALKGPFSLEIMYAKTISGLAKLHGIRNLVGISLSAGEFHDISVLRELDSLTSLEITQTPVNDLSSLRGLKKLQKLRLNGSPVLEISSLENLTALMTLGLQDTLVNDLTPLSHLKSLSWLSIRGTDVVNLSPLSDIESLAYLEVSGKQVPDLIRLERLPNLKTVYLIEQGNVDLSPLGRLKHIENLWIWGPPVIDLRWMRQAGSLDLTSLSITGLGIGSLSQMIDADAIGQLRELRRLTLVGIQIVDIGFIANLPKLTELSLGQTPIKDVTAIGRVQSLEILSLTRVPVVDISPQLNLSKLKKLNVSARTPARIDVVAELERRGVVVQR